MPLPYDYSRCFITEQNKDCPMARHCARRLDKGRESYQPFTAYKGGLDCDGYIDANAKARTSTGPVETG